jgi:hypothetical protein
MGARFTQAIAFLIVATRITFLAARGDRPLGLGIQESPDQVFDAWRGSKGFPFQGTEQGSGEKVWINPAGIAYWQEQGPSSVTPP